MTADEAYELAGRMYEATEIVMAIEAGRFKTVADVKDALQARANAIQQKMIDANVPMARSVCREEFCCQERDVDQYLALVAFDSTVVRPN